MTSLTLSKTAIFSLDQLAKQVYRESGLRCKLADKRHILRLLKFSSVSSCRSIRYRFTHLLKQLSYPQLKLLLAYGIQLPQRILELCRKQPCTHHTLTKPASISHLPIKHLATGQHNIKSLTQRLTRHLGTIIRFIM